jgi:hypothetical protein
MKLKQFCNIGINQRNKLVINLLGVKISIKLAGKYLEYLDMFKRYGFSFNTIKDTKKKLRFYEKSYEKFLVYMLLRFFFTRKISIPHLEYKLLTKCSLNCKSCCHYAPYFKEQMEPVTFEYFKESLDKLLQSVDLIYSFNFMGGDAMLHKDLYKMIEYAMSKKQIVNFNFTSNAILVPNDNFINTVKNKDNFIVYISDYRVNEILKPILKINELERIFKRENINYYILPADPWHKSPEISVIEKYNTKSLDCWLSGCKTYANGKMYFCPIQFYADFNCLPLENKVDELVDVMNGNEKNIEKELISFYLKKQYQFCSNCKLHTDKIVPNAEQL